MSATFDALQSFKKDDKFMCYSGEAFESPSPLFNLYRASQVLYPGEKILEEAREFTYTFLAQRLESNQLLVKWLISKHLPNEIKIGLEIPWYANLPRVEARFYIENYGVDDVWIGKSLYRMSEINNEAYLKLAKLDYNKCRAQHQVEWNHIQQWYDNYGLHEFGISENDLLLTYFLAAASLFEPERSHERFAWVKSEIVGNAILAYLYKEATTLEQKLEFSNHINSWSIKGYAVPQYSSNNNEQRPLATVVLKTLHQLSIDAKPNIGRDVSPQLHDAWVKWLRNLTKGSSDQIELLVNAINICAGHIASEETKSQLQYNNLYKLISKIYRQLHEYQIFTKVQDIEWCNVRKGKIEYKEIEQDMQSLLQLVLDGSDGINMEMKKTFLVVAKALYYGAYFAEECVDRHIKKVLFQKVV